MGGKAAATASKHTTRKLKSTKKETRREGGAQREVRGSNKSEELWQEGGVSQQARRGEATETTNGHGKQKSSARNDRWRQWHLRNMTEQKEILQGMEE
jgi:hypothetical protein